jgi:2-oxo-3-hexenedioate decarboxylase
VPGFGFTNRTVWDRYGVHAPIWGSVWDTTLASCDAGAAGAAGGRTATGRLSLARTCQPRLEPEIVFGLRCMPARGADLAQLVDAIEWLAPGFEVVQSHCPGWKFNAAQTVADSGLHARLLVGTRLRLADVAPDAATLAARLADAQVSLVRAGTEVERGLGANVLDSPLHALAYFVEELRRCPGAPDLGPGDVITTGTWTDAWPVQPGQTWAAHFSPPFGSIAVVFD